MNNFDKYEFLQFSDKIKCFPTINGDGIFSELISELMVLEKFDAIAIPLPESMKDSVLNGLQYLPEITLTGYGEPSGRFGYVTINLCNSIIMAMKIACQESIPFFFIDYETEYFENCDTVYPDSYVLRNIRLEKFCASLTNSFPKPEVDSLLDKRICYMAHQLHILELDYKNILYIPNLNYWSFVKHAYLTLRKPPEESKFYADVKLYNVEQESLAFILGELPYSEYTFVRNRENTLDRNFMIPDFIKEMLLAARENYYKIYDTEINKISPKTFQILLKYVRNLSLIRRRLTPDLYTLIVAAKQVVNNDFAIELAKTAKKYNFNSEDELYLDFEQLEKINFSLNKLDLSGQANIQYFNRLDGRKFYWKNVKLKKKPDKKRLEKYKKFLWNPHKICSYPPEDIKIENFNAYIKGHAKKLLNEGFAKSEQFTSSFKDGLDIKETLRHWYDNKIYIKDIPPARGNIDSVLIFFNYPIDYDVYNWKSTLYAEHDKESTISFIATDYKDKIIGPGIGRAEYAALAMWYPPRYIPDVWTNPELFMYKSPAIRIAAGTLKYSFEKYVVIISPKKPDIFLNKLAKQYNRKWIYIPLRKFSRNLIYKLKEFHILNGHKIRSFAADFITG